MKNKFAILAVFPDGAKQLCFDQATQMGYGEAEDEIVDLKIKYAEAIRREEMRPEMPDFEIISWDEAQDYRLTQHQPERGSTWQRTTGSPRQRNKRSSTSSLAGS